MKIYLKEVVFIMIKLVNQPELSVEFYDENIGETELVEPEDSNWYPVYKIVLGFLPLPHMNPSILDVGCGTGMFAKLLYKNGYTKYSGLDFSATRVKIARQVVPSFPFSKRNMFDQGMQDIYLLYNNIVILEVLEHIENDLEFLRSIPEGKSVIFSVPNYLSKSHVRAFPNEEMVKDRYGEVLTFLGSGCFTGRFTTHRDSYGRSIKNHSQIFVFKCISRGNHVKNYWYYGGTRKERYYNKNY